MVSSRWEHRAIKLNDGRVLVAGGATNCVNNMTASAEIYDPISRSFSATGSMSITRKSFPMAKLQDGSVLVFGGTNEGNFASVTDRVEKFNPATGTFSIVGYMAVARGEHGLCELPDGKFLLVGGNNYWNDSSPDRNKSAEIYDPVSNTSRLLVARTTLKKGGNLKPASLADGRCLISSWTDDGVGVELFDPQTETFSLVPGIPGYSGGWTSAKSVNRLPDGRALITPFPTMLFDPTTNSLVDVPRIAGMPHSGSEATTLTNGHVLVSSGSLIGVASLSPSAFEYVDSFAPSTNAGADLTVNEGASNIALDGTQSSGSQPLTYSWQQLGVNPGDPLAVALSGSATASPTFQAPQVTQNQTLTFQLTVTDSHGASASDTVDITVVNVNHQPVAVAGPHGYNPGCSGPITASIREGAQGSLDGRCSYDPDGDAITYAWIQSGAPVAWSPSEQTSATPQFAAPLSLGETLTFDLTVNDGQASSTPASMSVNVVSNSAPSAAAGTSQTVAENTQVTLAGAAGDSDAEDLATLSHQWQQIGGSPVTLANDSLLMPSFTAPWVAPGGEDFIFQLDVNDNYAPNPKSASDQVTVHVNNVNDPPTCNLAQSSVASLWPPNHKLLPVSIRNVIGTGDTLTVTGVTQDEAVNGLGDGDTGPDAVIEDGNLLLRAERSGTGDGRVYRVSFNATDAEGSCSGSVTVGVPRDNKKAAVDSGQAADSTQQP
jgi:hypothetical protein